MKFKHSKLTKRLISGAVAALMAGAMLPMAAFAADSVQGKWDGYQEPVYQDTSEGVTVTVDWSEVTLWGGTIQATVTIGPDAPADQLDINIMEALGDLPDRMINVPSDQFILKTTIINNSDHSYAYRDGSLVLGSAQVTGKDCTIDTFDGLQTYPHTRIWNYALGALGIGSKTTVTDATIGGALEKKGYNGIEELDEYYVAYYNDTYKKSTDAPIDSLKDAPRDYLAYLFSPPFDSSDYMYANGNTAKETNSDLVALEYFHFFNYLLTVNGNSMASYMGTESDTLPALDAQFAADMTALYPGGQVQLPDLTFKIDGEMKNNFQNYEFAMGLAFSLEQGQPKTDYPGLEKWIVTDDGNVEHDNVAAGDDVQFELKSNVPNDLINYMNPKDPDDPSTQVELEGRGSYQLTFHDELNAMLVNPRDFEVTIGTTKLDSNDYTVNMNPDDDCTFEVSLDLIALYNASKITDEDIEKATEIKVTYTATLDEDAVAGTYENTAWVTYPSGESEKDVVTVDTYAINIFKYDQANPDKGLAGAEFTLYADEACMNAIATGETGKDGIVRFDGLDVGTYYLKETKAPNGYVGSEEVLVVTITESAAENTVSVQFANSEIPHTGGTGTVLFTVAGAAIIAGAGVLFVISRKRKKVND